MFSKILPYQALANAARFFLFCFEKLT